MFVITYVAALVMLRVKRSCLESAVSGEAFWAALLARIGQTAECSGRLHCPGQCAGTPAVGGFGVAWGYMRNAYPHGLEITI